LLGLAGGRVSRWQAGFSQERMAYVPGECKVIYQSKDGKEEKLFDALEWHALLKNRHGTFAFFSLSTIIPNNVL